MSADVLRRASAPQSPHCCCGRLDCPYLAHSCDLLEKLERDLQTAGRLGQALLARHEAYIQDSEAERSRMSAKIEALEEEKRNLETRNARTTEENRCLLDKLDSLNSTVAESDAHIHALTATLRSTEQELQRLGALAARTQNLEKQLAALEYGQAQLHEKLTTTVEEERTAVQRWRQAERTIASLNDQIERIEREARQEREMHAEVTERMGRTRTVDKGLKAAARDIQGVPAARTVASGRNGGTVVSHFLKDILQNNANLQFSIVELRRMLLTSNEELERLREQLMLHQPLDQTVDSSQMSTLQTELDLQQVKSQELHFHHHYHAPPKAGGNPVQGRTQLHRRAKKKRSSVTPGCLRPFSDTCTPCSSSWRAGPTTLASTTTAFQTSVTAPQKPRPYRWSTQSSSTAYSTATSSYPGSPYSGSHQTSSIFDRISNDGIVDSSRPTTPDSDGPASPVFVPMQLNAPTEAPTKTLSDSPDLQLGGVDYAITTTVLKHVSDETEDYSSYEANTVQSSLPASERSAAIMEDEEGTDPVSPPSTETGFDAVNSYKPIPSRPLLRRAASHESVLSMSGMDIHTLRSRPSQLLAPGHLLSPSVALTSSGPVLSALTATATRPAMMRSETDGGALNRFLLSGVAADHRKTAQTKEVKGKLSHKVGGWVWRKRGSAPAPSSRLVSKAPASVTLVGESASVPSENYNQTSRPAKGIDSTQRSAPTRLRVPGINQTGLILGLGPEPAAPHNVHVLRLDEEALKESLDEG